MRLARIAHPEGVAFVQVEGPDGAETAREIEDHPFGNPTFTGRSWPLADTRLLAPILPSKVVAIGRNYADHAAELGNAVPVVADHLHQAVHLGDRAPGADPAAGVLGTGRFRG